MRRTSKNVWRSQNCSPTAQTGWYAELLLLQFPQSTSPNTFFSFNVKQNIIPENICIINRFSNVKFLCSNYATFRKFIKFTCPCVNMTSSIHSIVSSMGVFGITAIWFQTKRRLLSKLCTSGINGFLASLRTKFCFCKTCVYNQTTTSA